MKNYLKFTYLWAVMALVLCGCSEELFNSNIPEGAATTISLAYSDVSPKEIVFNTRATEAEERRLDNLYIYIFNKEGQLIGYKEVTSGLDQNTSDTKKATITGIKTRMGPAYIYAVANINTGLYPVATSEGTVEDGKLPIGLDEEKAQDGGYAFTKQMMMNLPFLRDNEKTIQISSAFLMSGSVNKGDLITIKADGTIAESNDIKLNRIVSKIRFNIKEKTGDGVKRSFTLSSYDIKNISMSGSLIGKEDSNPSLQSSKKYSNITGNVRGTNDVTSDGTEFFEFYLPENLQEAKKSVSYWNDREDDTQSNPKVFTNAPENGTYVVINGKYEETTSSYTRNAEVTYYVHLGDCSRDVNDYNVERNCKYTFNITVAGVNKIIVEAEKEGNEQPGAEGVVLEYGAAGKNLLLDSHYEYMVMRFYQSDIKTLKTNGHGYNFQVQDINGKTGVMEVTDQEIGNENGAYTGWIEFAIGGTYPDAAGERGTACSYPGKGSSNLYTIVNFLKLLYSHAEDTNASFWTEGSGDNRYIDATCFVDENYYPNKTWDKYVNNVPKRSFYVANKVEESKDGRSVYAVAAYGLQQYNIQTFYDRSQSGTVVAYGCETINDEEGKGFTVTGGGWQDGSYGSDEWNGRANMITDLKSNGSYYTYKWTDVSSNRSLIKACMSRNRDLNGDGKITNDEVRWYAPTIQQYAGLWIGEEILSTESKLYNKSTSLLKTDDDGKSARMLYYASTKGTNTFFSEEGMATNNNNSDYPAKLVRCIRNLKSNAEGYSTTPDKFYTYTSNDRKVVLDKVDANALNISGEQGELNEHTERSEGNKPAKSFYIANNTYGSTTQQKVVEGTFKCYGNYEEGDKKWRVPNQREFSIMYLLGFKDWNSWCRTEFSNFEFRKSWTYDGNYSMNLAKWTEPGTVRCIKVVK